MRPVDGIAAGLILLTGAAAAGELSAIDVDAAAARRNLAVKLEKVVDRGRPYLLVRLQATDIRAVDRSDGTIDGVSLEQKGLAFLPIQVACHRTTLLVQGQRVMPDVSSLCRDTVTLAGPGAAPLFIAFAMPARGSAEIVIPVTVLPPAAPIQTRLSRVPVTPDAGAAGNLVGERSLVIRTHVDDRP